MTNLSILVVTYNNEDHIEKCISSVLKNIPKNSEVIVIDNASLDRTKEILKKFREEIIIIESDNNLGFAKGNNLAVEKASGRYIFILNPDTEIKKPIFDELINFYENNSNIGVLVPKLVSPEGKTQSSVRKLPSAWGAFKEYILGIRYSYSEYVPQDESPSEIETAYGAAMLFSKELFEKLGGFDEKYFLYYEDIDFCRRVKELGKKVYYYPLAEIVHIVGGSKSQKDKYKLNYESSLKYHGFFKTLILQLIFRLRRFFN